MRWWVRKFRERAERKKMPANGGRQEMIMRTDQGVVGANILLYPQSQRNTIHSRSFAIHLCP
jgi:hypothetical protein